MINSEDIERAALQVNARLNSAAAGEIREMTDHETSLVFSGLDLHPAALARLCAIGALTGAATEALVEAGACTVEQGVGSGVLHGFLLGRLTEGGRRAAA